MAAKNIKSDTVTELFQRYGDSIYRFCLRMCGNNSSDAEDMTQETFIAAYKGLPDFKGNADIKTWLYKIALYRCRTLHRNIKNNSVSWDTLSADLPASASGDILQRMAIENAISKLPRNDRESFLLVKCEGFTCQEAAVILRIPTGTVKFRVYTAVKSLQATLDTSDIEPNPQHPLRAADRRAL